MLKIEALSKKFKDKDAVKSISFTVEPGEVLGLLGPNGAGKSTTMNSISGLLRPDNGSISICGYSVKTNPLEAKQVFGYLADPPAFLEGATCWENIEFISQVFKVPNFKSEADSLLKRLGLADQKATLTSKLSKGMRQRLGLVLLFLHAPKVILLDEPTTGLDPAAIVTLYELVREASARGAAIVISSHHLATLDTVCTKVLVLENGRTALYGTLADLRVNGNELKKNPSLEEIFLEAVKEKPVA